jgi:hypothetical protein
MRMGTAAALPTLRSTLTSHHPGHPTCPTGASSAATPALAPTPPTGAHRTPSPVLHVVLLRGWGWGPIIEGRHKDSNKWGPGILQFKVQPVTKHYLSSSYVLIFNQSDRLRAL